MGVGITAGIALVITISLMVRTQRRYNGSKSFFMFNFLVFAYKLKKFLKGGEVSKALSIFAQICGLKITFFVSFRNLGKEDDDGHSTCQTGFADSFSGRKAETGRGANSQAERRADEARSR